MTMKITLPALAALVAGLLLLSACETTPAALNAQCPSKWVAAGDNGAKADRYAQPNCS
jgi:starvation-inducible outer membrane lipoprotein